MQGTFTLSMKCTNQSIMFNEPKISERNGQLYIWSEGQQPEDLGSSYDAFDHPELISELITLVKKMKNGEDKIRLTKTWVKKWGVLNLDRLDEDICGQRMDFFWRQAEDFELNWKLYKYIANRDKENLEKIRGILESVGILKHLDDDPLINNQWNAMTFITKNIEEHTKNGIIKSSEIKHSREKDMDIFNIKPSYFFGYLIDALYMQFFLALTENKKVCPICESPFTPTRHDQVYCPSLTPGRKSSCYLTAKSRRYRESNKHTNLWE